MNKKIAFILAAFFIAVLGGVVYASDVTNADYMTKITVSNTGTAQTSKVATFTLSTADMIAADMLNSSANDCAMKTGLSGTDIPFMPSVNATYPWCSFVNSIGASTSQFQYLYSKGATGGTIRYFPGATGMSVPDGMTEPGNQFVIDMTGIFPILQTQDYIAPAIRAQSTAAATTAALNVAMPAGWASGDALIVLIEALDVAVATQPTISTPAGWTQLWHTAQGATRRFAGYYKIATGAEANPTTFSLDRNSYCDYRAVAITSGTYYGVPVCGVTATGAANPNPPSVTGTSLGGINLFIATCGTDVGMGAAPANYSGLVTGGAATSFVSLATREYASATDDPGTFGTAAGTWASNTIMIAGLIPNEYIFSHLDATNGGIACYPSSSDTITLKTFGVGASSITVSGLTDVEYDHIKVTLSGGTLSLIVGASNNSTAFPGSIPNSTANWTMCDGDAVLYVETISYSQGGAPVSAWEWEYDTTFHDSIGSNDGTPSFKTTSSSGISASVTSSEGTYEGTIPLVETGEGWTMITAVPVAPSGMFTDGGTGFPLGPQISTAATAAGDEPENWIMLFAFGIAIFVFVLVYGVTHSTRLGQRGSLILASLCAEIVLVYFYIVGGISGLSLIPAGLILVFLIFWRKSSAPVD